MAGYADIKYDDGSGTFVNNCFPVRTILKYGEPGEGAWLEAHRAEQRKRFKAVVCAKPPRTYSRLKQERIAIERQNNETPDEDAALEPGSAGTLLDGFFLMKQCCVEDPADLCSVNISGLGIENARPEDFQLFDNVAYINAADNYLNLDVFDRFSILRELELPVNGVSNITITHKMFKNLEMLDLSYNNLAKNDVLQLGYLRNLKVLYLSGNNFDSLPENLAGFYVTKTGYKKRRFPKLEILCLDDNHLNNYTAFAPLAGLKELKHLNLEKNEISAIPQLESKTIKHDNVGQSEATPAKSGDNDQNAEAKTDADEKDTNFTFGELKIPDLALLNVSSLNANADGKLTNEEDGECPTDSEDELDDEESPAIPFPQLRFLTLAHNYICEEEDLLPIAAWPNLTQVHIFDNPLTNERSGDPPMLKKFLTDRLGIDLIRKKPEVLRPVKEFPPPRKDRKISSVVPAVPKCDVDKLLQIEHSNRSRLPPAVESPTTQQAPLPPITKSPSPVTRDRATTQPEDTPAGNPQPGDTPSGNRQPEDTPAGKAVPDDTDGAQFFMTQLDEGFNGRTRQHQSEESQDNKPVVQSRSTAAPKPRRKVKNLTAEQLEMFKGYEELLIEDELEKDIHIPCDIHSTVKALHYALKHPVVNNHTMRLERTQKPFLPYKRSDVQSRKRPQTKAEKITQAMDGVRTMNTVVESPLANALTDKELTKKYPEAAKLLREIQSKYANAHSSAMGESDAVRAAINKVNLMEGRAQTTNIIYMADKDTSMTEIVRPATNM